MYYTDEEIRELLVERKKAEIQAKKADRRLTLKTVACIGSLFALIFSVWAWSWIAYAIM